MDHTHAFYTLRARYSQTLGEVNECRGKLEKLEADLSHLEATIRLFREDWKGEDAPPRKPRRSTRWMHHGQGIQTTIQVMREAGEPLTIAEIVRRIMEKRGITDTDPRSIKSLKTSTAAALYKRLGHGVMTEGPITGPKLWKLSD